MKAAPLLVSWHNENAPIYSAHFEPHGKGRLATAGGDNNVRVWRIRCSACLKVLTNMTALECREQWRGAEGHVPVYPRQAHTGCQRRQMVSAGYVDGESTQRNSANRAQVSCSPARETTATSSNGSLTTTLAHVQTSRRALKTRKLGESRPCPDL
jgi:WD40 repeat protein